MAHAEVGSIMAPYLEGSGWPAPPNAMSPWAFKIPGSPYTYQAEFSSGKLELIGCTIFRHSDHADYNSDWGIVCFEDDAVSSLEFSYD